MAGAGQWGGGFQGSLCFDRFVHTIYLFTTVQKKNISVLTEGSRLRRFKTLPVTPMPYGTAATLNLLSVSFGLQF